jgi:type IV secretion system protein VirB10
MAVDHTLSEDEQTQTPRFTGRQKLGFGVAGALLAGTVVGGHYLLQNHSANDGSKRPVPSSLGMPFAAPKVSPIPVAAPPVVAIPALPPPPAVAIAPRAIAPTADPGVMSKISAVEGPMSAPKDAGARAAAATDGEEGKAETTHDAFSKAMVPSDVGQTAYAELLKDPDYTIPAGTLIQCVMDTAINSQLLGFVRCHIPAKEGVWNASGTGIMLDAGTTIVGQIRSGLMQGQNRLFVLWTIARTPNQVVANLNSPAADALGRSGIPGDVDNHFWDKLLPTLIYSFVGYGPQIVSSALQKGGGTNNNYMSFVTPQQNLAESVLNQQLNIPPTLTVSQGDKVSIFVNRNISFKKVYKFRSINGTQVLSGE